MLAFNFNKGGKFVKPSFDVNALEGSPNVANDSYTQIEYSTYYKIKLCGNPEIKGNNLYLYLTSLDTNDITIKVRIYKDDNLVGESGLIKPNSYLEYIKVKNINSGDKIKVKIMGYDNEYHSAGVINTNIVIK